MAALDFSKNRFSVTNSSSTSTKAHPRMRMGLFSTFGHSYVNAIPPLVELARQATLSFKVVGTRAGRRSHGDINFGMFGSGRLYTSTYVPPPPDWSPYIIVIL